MKYTPLTVNEDGISLNSVFKTNCDIGALSSDPTSDRQSNRSSNTSLSSSGCMSSSSSTPTSSKGDSNPSLASDDDFFIGTIKRKPSIRPKIPLTSTTRNLAEKSDDALLEKESSGPSETDERSLLYGTIKLRRSHTDDTLEALCHEGAKTLSKYYQSHSKNNRNDILISSKLSSLNLNHRDQLKHERSLNNGNLIIGNEKILPLPPGTPENLDSCLDLLSELSSSLPSPPKEFLDSATSGPGSTAKSEVSSILSKQGGTDAPLPAELKPHSYLSTSDTVPGLRNPQTVSSNSKSSYSSEIDCSNNYHVHQPMHNTSCHSNTLDHNHLQEAQIPGRNSCQPTFQNPLTAHTQSIAARFNYPPYEMLRSPMTGPLPPPPEVFLREIQRVIDRKWKLAQQLCMDSRTVNQILGFRSIPEDQEPFINYHHSAQYPHQHDGQQLQHCPTQDTHHNQRATTVPSKIGSDSSLLITAPNVGLKHPNLRTDAEKKLTLVVPPPPVLRCTSTEIYEKAVGNLEKPRPPPPPRRSDTTKLSGRNQMKVFKKITVGS